MSEDNTQIIDFLTEMEEGELSLEDALTDYSHLLEDTELDQALLDFLDSRAAIKKTLKRVAKEANMEHALDLLD